ncbi:MAG: Mrp/NBP35 family ATP-binding protein [Anaerolineae bacterium]|jgi:Mrp family chromosome partitioning ATPase|nr:Mrp/NBP35 family ATP-binding protein [Anaerolineae bacterium]MDH7472833.1 Mrp/NBP35 family ATP-binding protein [Anaerolineae bacterium]
MITTTQIHDVLSRVIDPELGRNIVELEMVRDVTIEDKRVHIVLALTTLACPLKDKLVDDVKSAIGKLDENLAVEVELTEMTPEERTRILGQLQEEMPLAERFNDIRHVIAVMSGKGGVGKSSVAALLAIALRRQGQRVGVLDADITGPSIPRMFGLHQPPAMSPLGILPAETRTGIKVISINLLLPSEDEAVIWRGPLISGAIKQFWGEVFWGDLDTLVIDLPPGTSDASLTVMQSIPLSGTVLVTSPQDLAGMVVRKAARMAQQLNIPILGLVENMSYVTCPDCGRRIEIFGPSQAALTAAQLGIPMLGHLPLDPELTTRGDAGQVENYPATEFAPIAQRIMERVPAQKVKPVFGH